MNAEREEHILLAEQSSDESDLLDFKREYAPEKKAAFWAETIKDIVAFANTRGGVIVFGVEDDGSDAGTDCTALFSLDNANLADQIKKYTNYDFRGASVIKVVRSGKVYPAIIIEPIAVPMVFTRVGTYEIAEGKQKTAFSLGTIYFRHASKSEPCTREDISRVIQTELNRVREDWLSNIRKVVEAEPGSTVIVTKSNDKVGAKSFRITDDPNAPVARLESLSEGYPHRQTDVINQVNKKLSGQATVNTHDIQTVKLFEQISPEKTPHYIHKPHRQASPQYTDAFVELLVQRFSQDPDYFAKCREHWKNEKY